MNREIKFRGKAIHDGNWYYGAYFKHTKEQPTVLGWTKTKEENTKLML